MAAVFKDVEIYHRALGDTIIAWQLHPLFTANQPYTFKVYASRSGVGDFIEIATIEDNFFFLIDPNRWVWAKDPRLHYRIDLMDSTGAVFQSPVCQAKGNFGKGDDPIAREMIRKEDMALTNYTGAEGFLYKRRQWGDKCTQCVDWDTDEVTKKKCELCMGTGFIGGYFPPVSVFFRIKNKEGRRIQTDEQIGTVENQYVIGRTTACSWLDTGDVWVDCDTDLRYFVQRIHPIDFRGVPIIFDPVELRLAPTTDIVYKLRRPDDPIPVSSSSSEEA